MTEPVGGAGRVDHLSQELLRLRADFYKLEGRVIQLEQARSAEPHGPAAREQLATPEPDASELAAQLQESRSEALIVRRRPDAAAAQPWLSLAEALQERMADALETYCEERYRLLVAPKLQQVSAEKAVLIEAYEPVKRILELANGARTHHGQVMIAITAQAGTLRKFIEESERTCTGLGADAASPFVPTLPGVAIPEWSAVSVWNAEERRVRLTAEVDSWETAVNQAVAECFALAEQHSNALAASVDEYVEAGVLDRIENQAINLHNMIYFQWKQGSVAELQEPLRMLEGLGRQLVTRLGIEVLPAQEGAAFSSYQHVSIGEEEAAGVPPNVVVRELAPGYRKEKQTLQLAKVIVSKR